MLSGASCALHAAKLFGGEIMKKILIATALVALAAGSAQAAVNVTYFGAAQWGASDATLGIAGYTIENFENTALVGGLQIARSGGAVGNFAATSTLPVTSVFDGVADDTFVYGGGPLKAFSLGAWDGTHGLINHPGPSLAPDPSNWYADSTNWRDLTFLLPTGVTSVGFSLDQVERADTILINGNVVVSDLFSLVGGGSLTDTQSGLTFVARNGYLRFDSDAAITSLQILSTDGDGYMIDHFAFNALPGGVPEPTTWALMISGFGLVGAALRRRRVMISA